MKKVQKTLSVLLLAAVTLVSLNSCKKDDNVAPALGSATISGRLTANLDLNSTTGPANVSGVAVLVTVLSSDQVTNTSGITYATKVYTATSDANGLYSVNVEVGDKAVNATVKPNDFVYNQVQITGSTPSTVRTKYSVSSQNTVLYKGSNIVLDFAY